MRIEVKSDKGEMLEEKMGMVDFEVLQNGKVAKREMATKIRGLCPSVRNREQ